MTSASPNPAPPPTRRQVTVVTVHRAQAFSGVSAAGARLAHLAPPHYPWRPLVIGADITPESLASTPLDGAPGLDFVSWPSGADPVRQVLLVRDRLRKLGASVIVPNDLPHAFIAAALDAHRGVRCAAVIHGSYPVADDLYRRCLPLADAWRAVSPDIAAAAREWSAPGTGGGTITIGLDVPEEPPPLAHPLPPARPLRILFAGYLDAMNKRATDLADLADELHGLGARFLLTIAGDGPARASLERHLAAHIADGRAALLGAVPQHVMPSLYETHDVLALVSRAEGWPLVVMEALASGRPAAVTTGCGAAARLVRDGVNGLVVNTGDMRTLAARLASLAQSPRALEDMSRAAHETARDHLDLGALAPSCDRFIEEALGRQTDSAASDAPRRAALLAARWTHVLCALEAIGPCDPAPLCAAWLADLRPPPLAIHLDRHAIDLAERFAPVADQLECVVRGEDQDAPGHWLGWDVRTPAELAPGTLVLSREPGALGPLPSGIAALPLRLPELPGPGAERLLYAAERLRAKGCTRIALYGAGRHTRRLVRALERVPEIIAIIDDRAGAEGGPPSRLWGLPVLTPADAVPLGLDAVIISSDEHEAAMLAGAARWAGSIPVIPLYQP